MLSTEEDDHQSLGSTDSDDEQGEEDFGKAATDDHRNEADEVKKMTKMENKGVWIWKFLVVIIIIATATMVSVGSYTILRQEETENFQTTCPKQNNFRKSEKRLFNCAFSLFLSSHLVSSLHFLPTPSEMLRDFICVTLHCP